MTRMLKLMTLWGLILGVGVFAVQAAEGQESAGAHAAVGEAHAAADHAADHADGGHGEHHGLPNYAPEIGRIGSFPITNSMVVTWVVAIFLIVFAQIATRNIRDVPSGAQNFWEWIVESLYTFLEGILGAGLVKKSFALFASLFIFILATNWFGLIPGVGTVGWQAGDEFLPWFRGANADLNMTAAMSVVFMVAWLVWAIQSNGFGGFFSHIFGYHGDAKGGMKAFLILVFLAVGALEVVSIMFRPVSLSFRLYGNVFAGENLLEAMAVTGGTYFGWLVPIPFYFLELLVGLVQALVFTLLTAIFTALICSHHGGDDHAHEGGEGHH